MKVYFQHYMPPLTTLVINCFTFDFKAFFLKVKFSDFILEDGKSEIIGILVLRTPNDNNPKTYLTNYNFEILFKIKIFRVVFMIKSSKSKYNLFLSKKSFR